MTEDLDKADLSQEEPDYSNAKIASTVNLELEKTAKTSILAAPLNTRLIVLPIAVEEKTASGIYIPDTAKEKPTKGEVVAVGKDCEEVEIGDIVLYSEYSGSEMPSLKPFGPKYIIMRETDVWAVLLPEQE